MAYVLSELPGTNPSARVYFTDQGLSSGQVGNVGGFVVFALVFYLSSALGRFFTLYDACMGIVGRTVDATIFAKGTMPADEAWKLMRYLNAAHLLAYIGLSEGHVYTNDVLHAVNEKYQLLTTSEVCDE